MSVIDAQRRQMNGSQSALEPRSRLAPHEMGSTPSREDDDAPERGAHANNTIKWSWSTKLRTDISPFEPSGLNANPVRCQ
jgi:hypothetical protein